VVLRVGHRQPIGLGVEVVDLARGHGVRQRLPAAVRLELRCAVAVGATATTAATATVLGRRQLYRLVVVLQRRLSVSVVLPLVGRQIGRRHAALTERRRGRRRALLVQRGPLVLEHPLLEQLLLEPGLVQRVTVRVVEPLGHGSGRRPGWHVLATPVVGRSSLLPVRRQLFVVWQTALVQHFQRLVFFLHTALLHLEQFSVATGAYRHATVVLLELRRPGRRRLHSVGHSDDGRGHDSRVDLVHQSVGRSSSFPEADRRHVVGARPDAVACGAVVVRQERGAPVPRRWWTAVGRRRRSRANRRAVHSVLDFVGTRWQAGHLQVRLVLLQVGRALQVIRQVLAVALDYRAAAGCGWVRQPMGLLRGAGRSSGVL